MKESQSDISEIEKSKILTNLNTIVLSELKPVSLGLALLYLIFSFSHFFFLTESVRIIMTSTAAATVFILLMINLLLHKLTVPPSNAHPVGALIAFLVLFNGILHLYLTKDPQQTTNLTLLILGTGFLFLSSIWYIAVILITSVSWIIVAVTFPESGNWFHFGFFMLSSIVLSSIIHFVRKRTRIHVEESHIIETKQNLKLKILISELEESQTKYKDLFENANDLIQSVNAEGKYDYVNKAWEELMGYDAEDRKTLNFIDTIHEDYRDKCGNLFHDVGLGKSFQSIETVFVSKSGKTIFVEGSVNPQIKDGHFISTRAIFRDITERKKADAELEKLHEELKSVNERLKEAYSDVKFEKDVLQNVIQDEEIAFITDSIGSIIAITEKARNITGQSRLAILNLSLAELFEEGYKETLKEAVRLANIKNFHSVNAIMKTGKPAAIEYIVNIMKLNTLKEKQLLVILRIETV
ncbi:MAG: PAS domain S-box protein [Candidatus Marinimicrobia bacterium]|nr:PAS domain S-box protein [Candidatus Neomarinimicrobiota bacterium]